MDKYIIWDLHSLPEYKAIPSDEFNQVMQDYREHTFLSWQSLLEFLIKISFIALGSILYHFLKSAGTGSLLWWLLICLPFLLIGDFIEGQVRARRTRRELSAFIRQRQKKANIPEPTDSLATVDEKRRQVELYEHLRQVRVNIAVPNRIPSTEICPDLVLETLAQSRPTSIGLLKQTPGVTDDFIKNYGKFFVDEISLYEEKKNRALQ